MKADVDAVHKRICHLLAVIRTPSQAPAFFSIEKAALLEEQRKSQQLVYRLLRFFPEILVYCHYFRQK